MRRLLLALSLAAALAGCRKDVSTDRPDVHVYEPVRIATAYIPLIEKPDATRALLLGDEAKSLTNYFSNAGVKCFTSLEGRFDLIVIACENMSRESCDRLCGSLSENGVVAWIMDLSNCTFGQLWDRVNEFSLVEAHVWMPGSERWVLVGRREPKRIKLAAMLDVFTREKAFDDLARSRCGTLPEMFAGYLGKREEITPAFRFNEGNETVRPECFFTKDVPAIDWIAQEDVDRDITRQVLSEIRSMQVVRRLAVKGGIAAAEARDKKGEEEATAILARALRRNPNELFVLERLDRLERNARGFLEVGKVLLAMKCFETMVLIRPEDAAAVHNFGMCLKKIGKLDLAEKVLKRAEALGRGNGVEGKGTGK